MNEQLGVCKWVASTRWGDVRLTLPFGDESDIAGLTEQLEQWCQQTLSWSVQVEPVVSSSRSDRLRGAVSDLRLAPLGSVLTVPLTWFQKQPPPLALQGPGVQWSSLSFRVHVATLEGGAIEPSHLHGGGMVLLSEAFVAPWQVLLLADENPELAMRGHLNLNAGIIDLQPVDDVGAWLSCLEPEHADVWQVSLSRPVMLDWAVALGWYTGTRSVSVDFCCAQDAQGEFGLSAELRHLRDDRVLTGLVTPVMMGAALRVWASEVGAGALCHLSRL